MPVEMIMLQYTVYGGSFDPIHYGHLSLIERAIGLGYRVILVPAFRHAFGKRSAPFEHRVRMCELALVACHVQEQTSVCTIERDMAQGHSGPVYTYDVLCRLRDKLGTAPCLLVGPDITAEWERWHLHRQIDQEFGRLSLPLVRPIRSTDIRQHLQAGAAPASLTALLPTPVIAYIREHQLYGAEPSA
jgi:nicotinate-nucleotide adenylyltransferase